MTRFHAGCAVLIALGYTTGCDKGSERRELIAPDAQTPSIDASGSDGHDGGSGRRRIAMRDDCDPRDPAWAPTGGCLLRRGDVTFAEFNAEMNSALAASVIGHQAWRNDPSYLEIKMGKVVHVRNEGGRVHTFTEVAMFGGGKVPSPALNKGLVTAPECLRSLNVPPGGSIQVSGLSAGNHRFMCCIHPWMRALIKVGADEDHRGHGDN